MLSPRTSLATLALSITMFSALAACGDAPPPKAPVAPPAPVATTPPPPPLDVSPVADPAGLVFVGRFSHPDRTVQTAGLYAHLPFPPAGEIAKTIIEESLASVIDFSQPIDMAATVGGSMRSPEANLAISGAVRSLDDAKATLTASHKFNVTPGSNGQTYFEGPIKSDSSDNADEKCVLTPAPTGGRIVCGDSAGLDALAPYLARTVSRETWSSDIHVEIRPAGVRKPLLELRAQIPMFMRMIAGSSSPAVGALVDALAGELTDFVEDTSRIAADAELTDAGIKLTTRSDHMSANSLIARISKSAVGRVGPPPNGLFRLPSETDLAFFSNGIEPGLLDRPRQLIGDVFMEAAGDSGMPDAERKAARTLVIDTFMPLFTSGFVVYGKGVDAGAIDAVLKANAAIKPEDVVKQDEGEDAQAAQALGWHLFQIPDPITKTGAALKDWSALWNRPALAKWAKDKAGKSPVVQMHVTPPPAGVTLPKDSVHLEIVFPRDDGMFPVQAINPGPKPKTFKRKPITLHVIAVPDAGSTWIGFGLDAKLLAKKASSVLASAPSGDMLAKNPAIAALRDFKGNGAWMVTLRGVMELGLMGNGPEAWTAINGMPSHGATPIMASFKAEGPSASAAAGSATATVDIPRAVIEDGMKAAMSGRGEHGGGHHGGRHSAPMVRPDQGALPPAPPPPPPVRH